jgi:hypothetical protein
MDNSKRRMSEYIVEDQSQAQNKDYLKNRFMDL